MKLFTWLSVMFLATSLTDTATAAFRPIKHHPAKSLSNAVSGVMSTLREGVIKPSGVKAKYGLKGKLMALMLNSRIFKRLTGLDQPIEHQKKLGKLSLIFAAAAVILVAIPYVTLAIPAAISVLSIPSAIAGLVLGIKSLRGNDNIPGLIGLILSGSLLLIILGLLALALLFNRFWN